MRTIKISKNLQMSPERIKLLRHFIAYVFRAIQLKRDYKIFFVDDRHEWGLETTGSFTESKGVIVIYARGRALVDILRSTAHEFVHAKQSELGQAFEHTYLHFDNESEDEANAISGELVNAYSEVMGHERIYESA